MQNVSFYPYVALGLAIVFFEQFYSMLVLILQTREQAIAYGVFTIATALFNILLTIYLIVFLKMGAVGVLLGSLITYSLAFIFFIVILWKNFKITLRTGYLKKGLKYSLPVIPHDMGSTIQQMIDRVFINQMMSTAATGLYDIGFKFGYILGVLTEATTRTYVPLAMQSLKDKDENSIQRLKRMAYLLMSGFCSVGLAVSLYAREMVMVLTSDSYHQSYTVIPLIAFNFVAVGLYYFFVMWLFYDRENIRYVAVITVASTLLNGLLNYFLIKHIGMQGAALATLITTLCINAFIGMLLWYKMKMKWNYLKIYAVFLLNLIFALSFNFINYQEYSIALSIIILLKLVVLAAVSYLSFNILVPYGWVVFVLMFLAFFNSCFPAF